MIRDQELAGLAMTLGRDANISITVNGDASFCEPDGSHINIARMPSTPLGRMLMTGLVFHEVGHKNYTQGGKADGLLGDMMNVIEDIRVDMETIKARPGTCFNLEAVTTHYVNKGSLKPKNLTHALLGKVMSYGFGRLMGHKAILPLEPLCDEMMIDAFGQDFIDEVEAIIKDIPNLRSTADTTIMARKLINLLINQQTQPPPKQTEQNDRDTELNDTNSGASSGNQGQNVQCSNSAEQDNGSAANSNSPASKFTDEQKAELVTDSGGRGAGSNGGKRPTADEIEEMLKSKTDYGDLSTLIQSELNSLADSYPCSGKQAIPMLPIVGRLKPSHHKLDEVAAISAASKMRAKLMGMLQSVRRKSDSYGLSGRKLATGRLTRMASGDPRIFRKKVERVEVNTAVTVLLDLSGSMSDKYELANSAAFALHNTLYGLHGVAVCSLEFSGKDQQPEVNVLVDFGMKPLSENFNHYPFDETPTHNAIWAARAMLLQRPEPRKIMLILTDGCPDDASETRAATRKTLKDGIEMAAIGINDNSVRHYWENQMVIDSIQELPAAMFGIMKDLLIKR